MSTSKSKHLAPNTQLLEHNNTTIHSHTKTQQHVKKETSKHTKEVKFSLAILTTQY